MAKATAKQIPQDPWDEIKHFVPADFQCQCGLCDGGKIDISVVQKLDYMREIVDMPFKILRGTRCRESDPNREHVPLPETGVSYAVDIFCPDLDFRFRFLKSAMEAGFKRIEIGREHIHVDDHPELPQEKCWLRY